MTAAEIFAIPGAKRFWPTIERVEDYIKIKKEQKAKNGGKDIKDVWAKRQSGSGSFSLNIFIYQCLLARFAYKLYTKSGRLTYSAINNGPNVLCSQPPEWMITSLIVSKMFPQNIVFISALVHAWYLWLSCPLSKFKLSGLGCVLSNLQFHLIFNCFLWRDLRPHLRCSGYGFANHRMKPKI